MTYRQWMEENRPDRVRQGAIGGVDGCPGEYFPGAPRSDDSKCCRIPTCKECWDREMPEKKTPVCSGELYPGEFEQAERVYEENTDCHVADAPRNDTPKDDPVNHPSHYCAGGIECIDAIGAALCKYTDGVDAWLAGQVIKYLWRAPLKGTYAQDQKKAQFYLNRLVKRQEEKK